MWSSPFEAFLRMLGAEPGERRFVARNHVLDERPARSRVSRYESYGMAALTDDDAWYRAHERYLNDRIRPRPGHVGAVLRRADAPDTFAVDPLFATFSGSAAKLDLVRVVKVDTFAMLARRRPDEVLDAIGDPVLLADVVADFNDRLDGRPAFAAFLEDVVDLLPDDEADAPGNWADRLRDLLGLPQIQPPPNTPIPILVLRYPVAHVVGLEGLGSDRPLAVPTVVDIDQFPAFCPAPTGQPVGQLVDLAAAGRPPAGEILHPMTPLRPSHVFRLGYVRTAPPALDKARGRHLRWLQSVASPDFGVGVDDDVLAL